MSWPNIIELTSDACKKGAKSERGDRERIVLRRFRGQKESLSEALNSSGVGGGDLDSG